MIEFALCIPFLLLMLFSLVYFGRYFLLTQVILHAAQEAAKVAARTPNMSDDSTRESVRGFTSDGSGSNTQSVIYAALGSANLLSNGSTGDMPDGAKIEILPWDSDGTTEDTTPDGTIQVRIDYPFQLLGNIFDGTTEPIKMSFTLDGSKPAFTLPNFTISQRAIAAQEIYQTD